MGRLHRVAVRAERLIYRIAALPIAVQAYLFHQHGLPGSTIRGSVAWRYWHPDGLDEWIELIGGLLLWPVVVLGAIAWFTARNGAAIRKRARKGLSMQVAEQLRLYFSAGIIAPWYYIYSLHDAGPERARSFLQRAETKWGVYSLLRPASASPLGNKKAFADRCKVHGVRCIPYAMWLDGSALPNDSLPDSDLFVKPARGRGGKGAERWDRVAPGQFRGPRGDVVSADDLLLRLHWRAKHRPLLVQERLDPHPAIADLTSGALPTVRALTCLDPQGEPEVVATVFRMSVGTNRTVDNIHAGGIACAVSLDLGILGPASDLGSDARLGWLAVHPDSGARIEGRRLPCWDEIKGLAVAAHRAFADRVVVGWDIAILEDGPTIVEGNGGPDMDLMQRFMRTGFCERHRFGELLAWHLRDRMAERQPDRMKFTAPGAIRRS
jgi:hypothetical protein